MTNLTLSASGVSTFLFCPLKWKYVYVDKKDREPSNIYMVFGSAIHKALEVNYRQKIKSTKDLPSTEVIKVFRDYFLAESKNVFLSSNENVSILTLKGEELLNFYLKNFAPIIQPIEVEKEFIIELPNTKKQAKLKQPVIIKGYIDLLTDDGGVRDYKNSGETDFTKRWTQNYVDNLFQLTMYSLAYRKMYNKPEKYLQVDVFGRTLAGPKFLEIKTQRNDVDLVAFVQLLTRIMQIYESGYYYPNLNNCSQCFYKGNCKKTCF